MRMQTAATTNAPCGHGFANHAGFLFERQRTAMRQNAFARARSATTKRKARDSDDSDDSTSSSGSGDELQQQQHQPKRVLLHGLKRMRVSSPPSTVAPPPPSPAASTSTAFGSPTFATNTATANCFGNSTARPNTFTSAATSDIAMEDDDDTNTTDGKQAIVPANKPRSYKFATAWPNAMHATAYTSAGGLAMPPSDASCTALVLFGGASSIPRNVSPRIELVESDDDETSDNGVPLARSSDDDNESDSKPFVRFEEINDDDMEID